MTEFGAQALVIREPGELAGAVKAATEGRGAALLLDAANGGALLEPCLNALADRGRLLEITTARRRVEFDLLDFYRRQLSLHGVNTLALDSAAGAGILEQLAPLFQSGVLRPPRIAARYSLEEAQGAYAAVQKGGGGGKAVFVP